MKNLGFSIDNLEMYGECPDLEEVQRVAEYVEESISERYNLDGFYVGVHIEEEYDEIWPQIGVKTKDTFGTGARDLIEDTLEEELGREIKTHPGQVDQQGHDVYTLVDETDSF